MKRSKFLFNFLISSILFALGLIACKKNVNKTEIDSTNKQDTVAAQVVSYQMIWSDEFEGSSVNTSKWNFETGGGGWGNNEQQYYQSSNATVANGMLSITARKEDVGGRSYSSARMITLDKRHFTYGRIEARIKLPLVQGLWPAFWTLGSNIGSVSWPGCGEVDIMEHINTDLGILGTMHWNDGNGYKHRGGYTPISAGDYHVYRIDWTPTSINWSVDGKVYHTENIANNFNSTEEFHRPFFLILNMAVGGNLPGQTIDENMLPATMYVDYVRVYKIADSRKIPLGQTITLKGSTNKFVSSEDGTAAMNCNRETAGNSEKFIIIDAGEGKVALASTSMGKYVSSENGMQPITCNRASIGDWERFDWVVNSEGKISLKGNNGKYVSSENGSQAMTCNRTSISDWETFSLN